MITKREKKLSQLMIAVQVLISVLLFISLELFFPQPAAGLFEHSMFLFEIAVVWSYLFYKFDLGIIFRTSSFSSMIRGYLATVSLGGLLLFVQYSIFRLSGRFTYSIYYFLAFCVANLVVLISFKLLFYCLMNLLRRKGYNSRQVVIIADQSGKAFVDSFIEAKDWGYRIKAIVTPETSLIDMHENTLLIDNQPELTSYITDHPVDDVFYCLSLENQRFDIEKLIHDTDEIGVSLHIMEQNFQQNTAGISPAFAHRFTTYQTIPPRYFSLKLKDAFDFLFSAFVLIFLSPVFGLIALAIKLEDRGPVFFKQERIGLNGRRFTCYKFRSMIINAETLLDQLKDQNESDGPTFKMKKDPRITKVGRILRKTSLDELPQFYNVIKGEMSVVGPRPPLLREVQQYKRSQLRRLSMRPGITCIWQVSGRNEVSFDEWMQMDLNYIDNWSILVDVKTIIATIGVVLKANGR